MAIIFMFLYRLDTTDRGRIEVKEMTVGDDTFVLEKTFELVSAPEPHILLNYKRRTEPMVEQLSLFDRL